MLMIILSFLIFFIFVNYSSVQALENCDWDNRRYTLFDYKQNSNTSYYNNESVIKKSF